MKPASRCLIGFIIAVSLFLGICNKGYGKKEFLSDLINWYRQQKYQTLLIRIENHPEQFSLYPNQIPLLKLISLLSLDQLDTARQFLLDQEKNYKTPLQEHLWSLYLDSLLTKKRTDLADEAYRHLQSISTLPILLHLQSLKLAESFLTEKNFNQATFFFIEALNHAHDESEHLSALMGVGRVLAGRGNFWEALLHTRKIYYSYPIMTSRQARKLIESFITQLDPEPFSMSIRLDVAAFLFQLGRSSETIRFLNHIDSKLLPSFELQEYWILWIRVHLRNDDLSGMQKALDQAMSLMESPDGWFYTGVIHQRRGEYRQAANAYEDLFTRFPDNEYTGNAIRNLSFCYRVMGDEPRYLATLDRMIGWYPSNRDPVWEKFWYLSQKANSPTAGAVLDLLLQYPEEKNRALFWKYKTDQAPGNIQFLEEIIRGKTLDYYFVRAWQELSLAGIPLPSSQELFPNHDYIPKIQFNSRSQKRHWSHYLLLSDLSLKTNAEVELLTLHRLEPDRLDILYEMSRFYARNQENRKSQVYALSTQSGLPEASQYKNLWKKIYPEFYLPIIIDLVKPKQLDPYLVLSLIKAESTFEPDLISTAGAIGLMQLMPSTASWMVETGMSAVVDYSEWHSSRLKNPKINIELGVTYFDSLMKQFDQKICPAIIAYNAGPGSFNTWFKPEDRRDPDRFVENIPYTETKNYLKKVVSNYFYYSMIYRGQFTMLPCIF